MTETASPDFTTVIQAVLEALAGPGVGAGLFDGKGRLSACNPEFASCLGLGDRLPLLGLSADALRARVIEAGGEAEGPFVIHLRNVAQARVHALDAALPDGRVLELSGRPVDGAGYLAVYREIGRVAHGLSGRAISERDYDSSERRFSKVFQANPGLTAISVPATGVHLDVNEAWLRTLGYRREEVIGRTAFELGIWADQADRRRVVDELLERGSIRGAYARLRTRAGEVRDMLISGELIELDGEDRLLLSAQDITDLKAVERRLQATLDRLTDTYSELHRFIEMAFHDLQEPVRAVAAHTGLLARRYAGRLGDDGDEFIGFVLEANERLRAIVADLQTYARLIKGPGPSRPTHLDTCLRGALDVLAPRIEGTGATVETGPLPLVMGNGGEFTDLFIRLIGNALSCRHPGGGLRVRVGGLRKGREYVISISDNGPGLPAEHLERMFLPFVRLRDANQPGESGLGLAICKRIVETHGGRIWAESTADRGTTIRIRLAVPEAAADPASPPRAITY